MSPTLASAVIVRAWTRIYTSRMQPALRDARRDEIESDLWELHEDARRRGATPTGIAVHMLLRLLRGAGDDLMWRAEHAQLSPGTIRGALWATAAASVVFVWWLASAVQALEPPAPLQAGGINVVRLLSPTRAGLAARSALPPVSYLRLRAGSIVRPPPPPPPPPKPEWR
jgi:hypothetical protein